MNRIPVLHLLAALIVSLAAGGCSADSGEETSAAGGSTPRLSLGGTSGGVLSSSGARASGGRSEPSPSGSGGSLLGGASSAGSLHASGGFVAASGSAGTTPTVPPPAGPNGESPYLRPCHGETAMCGDVVNLRCLGIRDASTIYGYSCSNPCASDAECSKAPSGVEASAACVDFVTARHCLFVCLTGGATKSCPAGMVCSAYPGASIGYCLWP